MHTASPSTRLYTVVRSTALPTTATGLLTAGPGALYLRGTSLRSPDLFRVSLHPFLLATSTYVAGLTDAAFGLGVLWATAGDELVRLDPTSLAATASFTLPGAAHYVTVAAGKLWVTTSTSLLAVDPSTGGVQHVERLGFNPVAMAAAPDGARLYVLGDRQPARTTPVPKDFQSAVLSSFSTANGVLVHERTVGPGASGPLAPTKKGVWIPVQEQHTRHTTTDIELYEGADLAPGAHVVFRAVADVGPYVVGSALWIVGIGYYRTKCASVTTGHIYAAGFPMFSNGYGDMLSVGDRAFLLRHPYRQPLRLLEIKPTAACTP